jgi:SlyX protein
MSDELITRIVELECRIALQEDMLQSLNQQVHELQQQHLQLRETLNLHQEWLRQIAVSNIARPDEETLPPHY